MSDHPGMVPPEKWAQTAVHKASTYSCGACRRTFESPDKFYDHLDACRRGETEESHD